MKKCFPTRPKLTHSTTPYHTAPVCVFTYVFAYKAVNIQRVNKPSEELATSLGSGPKLNNNKRWVEGAWESILLRFLGPKSVGGLLGISMKEAVLMWDLERFSCLDQTSKNGWLCKS